MKQVTQLSFKGQPIYIGMDVHLQKWVLSICTKEFELETKSFPASLEIVSQYLHRMYPNADYYSAYEAGYCGYWIHEKLVSAGINNIVINPCDVPTTDKEKKRKRDAVDSRKLARSLRNKELKGIYIPDKKQQEDRLLVRSREDMVKKQTRCKNQIKSVLAFFGIYLTDEEVKNHWSKAYINWLRGHSQGDNGKAIRLKTLIEELEFVRKAISMYTRQIRSLSKEERYKRDAELITKIPGISTLSAMIILTELGDIKIYNRLDKLCGYVGLIPDEHTTGDKEKKSKMTKRGNRRLRRILIESSWVAIRKEPALYLAYKKYSQRHGKTKAIIKIARKLLNRIRCVLVTGKEYEIIQPQIIKAGDEKNVA